jgi:hypothetical protein
VKRVSRRLRLWAGFRCAEPVVVLESDDWGLRRHDATDLVARWGTPTGWAAEEVETAADLDRLAEVLGRHGAVLTMNLIAANPDHAAIEADGFSRYHDRPLDETAGPDVLDGYRRGQATGAFCLELHGRAHADPDTWLEDLREGRPGARELFAAGVDGGLSLTEADAWRYHSEVATWSSGHRRPAAELVEWLRPAVDTVTRVAGRPPRAVVGPHYVVTPEAEIAWARLGLDFLEAAEHRLDPAVDGASVSYLGQRGGSLVHLTRTARFDPRPGREGHHVAESTIAMTRCFEQGLPAVIDTHRINFTGPWADDAAAELDDLLAAADRAGARYLSTPELGDEVVGTRRTLTPTGRALRLPARALVGRS